MTDTYKKLRARSTLRVAMSFLLTTVIAGSTATARMAKPSAPQKTSAAASDPREHWLHDKTAPIKVLMFIDYQSPSCATAVARMQQAMRTLRGRVRWILKHVPSPEHPEAMRAHQAALAAEEQGSFWKMQDLILSHPGNLQMSDLISYARELRLDLPRFEKRLATEHYRAVIEQDLAMAQALGVDSTPTLYANGQRLTGVLSEEQLQFALAGKPVPGFPGAPASAANLDLSHSPARGPSDAPVTIVEFSDLQCPFCARFTPALQELIKRYPVQVRWVFKNYPLSFHADAELAHRAALASDQQGKFWEMHDLLFAGQSAIKRNDLLEKARRLDLDMTRFTADLDSNKVIQRLEADMREGGSLRIDGTPTFFVNGREYSGAMTIDQMQAIVNQELAALGKPAFSAPGTPALPQNAEISFGETDAPVTLTWFSDLQSNLSLEATMLVRRIMNAHPGRIRLVFKNRPLEVHVQAMALHQALMAANTQGKFWEMHDLIVAAPQKSSRQDLLAYARQIGLNEEIFEKDLDSGKYQELIDRDLQEAKRRAVLGAPVFFLNAARIDGLQNDKLFNEIIDGQLAAARASSAKSP